MTISRAEGSLIAVYINPHGCCLHLIEHGLIFAATLQMPQNTIIPF